MSASIFSVVALTLKTSAKKNHPKIPSAIVVCCKFLLTLFKQAKYRDKQCGPRSDCSESTLFVGKASKTFQQTTKAHKFCCDWRFKGK